MNFQRAYCIMYANQHAGSTQYLYTRPVAHVYAQERGDGNDRMHDGFMFMKTSAYGLQ